MESIAPLSEFIQLGFAAVMAIALVWIIWQLGIKVVNAFKEISDSHQAETKRLSDEHRSERSLILNEHKKEREDCYAKHAEQFNKFDDTLRMFAKAIEKKTQT